MSASSLTFTTHTPATALPSNTVQPCRVHDVRRPIPERVASRRV